MMTRSSALQTRFDRLAIGASGLCLVHCLALPVLFFFMPAMAAWLTVPEAFHLWMLALAVPSSALALWMGRRRHRHWTPLALALPGLMALAAGALLFEGERMETALSVGGAALISVAHGLNRRYAPAARG